MIVVARRGSDSVRVSDKSLSFSLMNDLQEKDSAHLTGESDEKEGGQVVFRCGCTNRVTRDGGQAE